MVMQDETAKNERGKGIMKVQQCQGISGCIEQNFRRKNVLLMQLVFSVSSFLYLLEVETKQQAF